MAENPAYVVAIIGGAVSGSEAANKLADRGIVVIIFDMKSRPYGKIEDGLPIWHEKLRQKYIDRIDNNLSHPNVHFIPNTKIGTDIDFIDLVKNWGFSAILLANGAWKDRPLALKNVDQYIGKGLVYQNSLVSQFNRHYVQSKLEKINYPDGSIVIGGGLASLDVVKILMLQSVHRELMKRDIDIDILTLERESIKTVLSNNGLSLKELGLKGCTLFYRKRKEDMPLAPLPADTSAEKREATYRTRKKILTNFQEKFLFKIKSCHVPTDIIVKNDRLIGLKFKKTRVKNGNCEIIDNSEYSYYAPLVVSSIGSIPEPINGISMSGELYAIKDPESGQLQNNEKIFALGNVVTGKGNIRTSLTHGKQVSDHVMDYYLAWKEDDYKELLKRGAMDAKLKTDLVLKILENKKLLPVKKIKEIIRKANKHKKRMGGSGPVM
ncbi:MAG: hypothetical protein V3U16_02340, partial [Candidatus Neomarinimicrobiota bacterium]